VVARGDGAEVLEAAEGILDAMPLFVGFPAEAERPFAGRRVGNDGLGATIFQPLPQRRTVVGLVAEKLPGCLGAPDQAPGGRTVVSLSAAQQDGKKTAFSICDCVDLRVAPAA